MTGFWTETSAEQTGSLLSRYAHAPWQRRGAQPCSDSAGKSPVVSRRRPLKRVADGTRERNRREGAADLTTRWAS